MDIQKEREAFESAMFKLADGQTKNEINPVNGQYMYGVMEVMWKVWQASKSKAVPEGFVLVEREKLAMIFETATNALVYHAAQPKHDALSIIQGISRRAMTESQEPK